MSLRQYYCVEKHVSNNKHMRVYFVVFWVKKNEPLRMGTRNRGSFKRATKFVVKILTSSLIAWQNKYNQNEIIDPFVTTMQ